MDVKQAAITLKTNKYINQGKSLMVIPRNDKFKKL